MLHVARKNDMQKKKFWKLFEGEGGGVHMSLCWTGSDIQKTKHGEKVIWAEIMTLVMIVGPFLHNGQGDKSMCVSR